MPKDRPIDELDAGIVEVFTAEPRVGVLECSRRLGVARGTVQARLDRMTRDGVIGGWGPVVDPSALGYVVTAFVTLEIRQHHPSRAAHDAVAEHLAGVPEVLEAHTITGAGDVLARIVARSNADLQRVIDRVAGVRGGGPRVDRHRSRDADPLPRGAARPGGGLGAGASGESRYRRFRVRSGKIAANGRPAGRSAQEDRPDAPPPRRPTRGRHVRPRRRRGVAACCRRRRRTRLPCRSPTRSRAIGWSTARRAHSSVTTSPAWSPTWSPAGSSGPHHAAERQIPASNVKLLTAVSALETFGPAHRFPTRVMTGATARRVVLVGGGDPSLSRADLRRLATRTVAAKAAEGVTRVRVDVDDSLFPAPTLARGWKSSYVTEDVSPVRALVVDQHRRWDTSLDAGQVFATILERKGLDVGRVLRRVAPSTATLIAESSGDDLASQVGYMLRTSDNDVAEVLHRMVAVQTGLPATWAGAAQALVAALGRLGVTLPAGAVHDGSGLSRADRLRPAELVAVLRTAFDPAHPNLASLQRGSLAVAGVSGTLAPDYLRYVTNPTRCAAGLVEAKTGSLQRRHQPQRLRARRRRQGQALLVPAQRGALDADHPAGRRPAGRHRDRLLVAAAGSRRQPARPRHLSPDRDEFSAVEATITST